MRLEPEFGQYSISIMCFIINLCYNQCRSVTSSALDDEVQRQHEQEISDVIVTVTTAATPAADTGIHMGSPDCVVTPQQGSDWSREGGCGLIVSEWC